MKRLLLVGLIGISFGFGACSNMGGTASTAVPDQVITAFNQRYPYAEDVQWNESDGMYEAEFTQNGKEKEVKYRQDGTLLEASN